MFSIVVDAIINRYFTQVLQPVLRVLEAGLRKKRA
jgi:hypothetical protein